MRMKFRTPYQCQNGHFRWLYWEPIDGFKNDVEWGEKHPECKCPTGDIGEGFRQIGDHQMFIGIKDKHGNDMYVGDIYLGTQSHMTGDGYLRKGYPKTINVYCLIGHNSIGFTYPEKIVVIPEHRKFREEYQYRAIGYILSPLRKENFIYNDKTGKFDIEGDGETDHRVELVGNIYQTPELLIKLDDKNLHKVW